MTCRLLLFFLLCSTTGFSQLLKGQVTDASGNPVPFAKIRVLNTSYGTVANALGNFQLELRYETYVIHYSAVDFAPHTDTLTIRQDVTLVTIVLGNASDLPETVITARSKKDMGREIMQQVIAKRPYFRDRMQQFSCSTYCFTSLERESPDSLKRDSVITKQKMNITEWNGTSYYKANNRYKDVITGFTDFTEPTLVGGSVIIVTGSMEDNILEPTTSEPTNPYIFVNGIRDADINLFDNQIQVPGLSQRPLISPMASTAFLYYTFYLESSFYDSTNRKVYEIRVEPRFREEALFEGTLFVRDASWELVSYELGINKGALTFFKEMRLICDFEQIGDRTVPTRREFIYLIREGKTRINGNIRLMHSDYHFEVEDSDRKFWLETTMYTPEALTRDTSYWNAVRPFHLKPEEITFIHQQDSIAKYHASEEYLEQQDSTYNTLKVWDFLFNGVGFRNTFKKQELYIEPLINQVVPFGVGGYRHRLNVSYEKTFRNNHALSLAPQIDYGFHNKDLKGQLGVGYLYNPRRFSKFFVEVGDVYDFLNGYQSIQGTFSPANRVRNRKIEVYHRMELVNGLYFKCGIFYSNRQSIENIDYPAWVNAFGTFSKPQPFDGYKVFMTDIELSYHFRQQYMLKGNRKIVTSSQWPVVSLQYKKGYPKLFGGQSDFDFVEARLTDEINLHTFGTTEIKLLGGAFLRKNNLRLVENKFFRTSDKLFFSNPVNSLQLLDTALNTANSYLQFTAIHHFNGFFMNKIWLLNRLKLTETIGGSFLAIPDAQFAQAEFYAGLERTFRIKKQLFRIGVYAVTADSAFDKATFHFKVGVNFYDSFHRKWDY